MLEGAEPQAKRLTRPKQPLTDILLMEPERLRQSDPSTLTAGDMSANAFGNLFPYSRRYARDDAGKIIEHRIGNYVDRAMSKVEAWADTFDEKAVCICAGQVRRPSEAMA